MEAMQMPQQKQGKGKSPKRAARPRRKRGKSLEARKSERVIDLLVRESEREIAEIKKIIKTEKRPSVQINNFFGTLSPRKKSIVKILAPILIAILSGATGGATSELTKLHASSGREKTRVPQKTGELKKTRKIPQILESPQSFRTVGLVWAKVLNLREGPGVDERIIGKLRFHDMVRILDRVETAHGEWMRVEYISNRDGASMEGFVASEYLRLIEQVIASEKQPMRFLEAIDILETMDVKPIDLP